ncbi:MAG: HD domain-containing protein [Candidatus Omnitrophota bacterium]
MGKKFISEFKTNDKIDSFFQLRKKNLKLTKKDTPYLELTLADKTGTIEGRVWIGAEDMNSSADTGDIVRVKGTVDKFREENQIKIDLMKKAEEGDFDRSDMVRVAENISEVKEKIKIYLEQIEDPWIKKLAGIFWGDAKLVEKFSHGVGGKSWHNAYVGGLMEHTYEVMCIVDKMCGLYPEADRSLAVFGAFIHDIGKVFELDADKMEYTVLGGLIGHIGIGHKMLVEKISEIENFPPDISMKLEHIILSHHGEYEQQSPVLPKTLEATIVYQVDELVSQANAVKEIIASQSCEGRVWSNFVVIKNRKYYLEGSSPKTEPECADTKEDVSGEEKSGEEFIF